MRVWVDKGLPGGLLAGVQGVKQEGRGEQGTEQPTCSDSVIMVCAASPGAATGTMLALPALSRAMALGEAGAHGLLEALCP